MRILSFLMSFVVACAVLISTPPANANVIETIIFDGSPPAQAVVLTPKVGDQVLITNSGASDAVFRILYVRMSGADRLISEMFASQPVAQHASGTVDFFVQEPSIIGEIVASVGGNTIVIATFSSVSPSTPPPQQVQSPPPSTATATATATTTAVTSDVFARTTATISGNTRMMDMALTRFIGEQNSGAGDIISRDSIVGPLGLQITGFNLDANDDGGTLFSSMSYMDVANGWRRVGFAELRFQDTQGVGSTLSLNGRISQERYLTASTLYGYFLGAELHRSDIKGSFGGDQNSFGLLAGAYTVAEAENGLIGSAYAALGFNRNRLSIGDSITVTSRDVVWLFPEQLRSEFVPVLHRLQGRSGCQC